VNPGTPQNLKKIARVEKKSRKKKRARVSRLGFSLGREKSTAGKKGAGLEQVSEITNWKVLNPPSGGPAQSVGTKLGICTGGEKGGASESQEGIKLNKGWGGATPSRIKIRE